jgi:hypothetical protein
MAGEIEAEKKKQEAQAKREMYATPSFPTSNFSTN